MSKFHWVMPTSVAGTVHGGPIADTNTGGSTTDTVCMSKYRTAYFQIFWGVGTTGTMTITAIPITAVAGTTTTAIPFQYKRISATETNTDWAWATSNSLLTTAGSSQVYVIKVRADDLPQVAGVTYEYVYLNTAETSASALLGGCIIFMADPRYDEDTLDAVTA